MRDKATIVRLIEKPGLIAVVRAKKPEQVPHLVEALLKAGLIAIEITMTTPRAIEAIRTATHQFGRDALIGVGTVLDGATAREAVNAGAEFVVSPVTKAEIAAAANQASKPVMLGAYTPTEAQNAFESGADYIKLFPADGLGVSYIKALRAPLPHLKIVPTGGVDLSNLAAFYKAGCPAVGVGSSLLNPQLIESENWSELTSLARQFVETALAAQAR